MDPPTKFGELRIKYNKVESFEEKPKLSTGYINGGGMVANNKLFCYPGDDQILEYEPKQKLAKENNLGYGNMMVIGNVLIPLKILVYTKNK